MYIRCLFYDNSGFFSSLHEKLCLHVDAELPGIVCIIIMKFLNFSTSQAIIRVLLIIDLKNS